MPCLVCVTDVGLRKYGGYGVWSWWDSLESVAKFDSVMSMLRIMGVILAAAGLIEESFEQPKGGMIPR
jgi:hypothetical protein